MGAANLGSSKKKGCVANRRERYSAGVPLEPAREKQQELTDST